MPRSVPPPPPPSQQRQKHTPPPPPSIFLFAGITCAFVRPLNVATDGKPTLAARRPHCYAPSPPPPPPPVLKPPPTIRPSRGFDNKQFPTLTRIVPTTGGQITQDNYLSTLVNSPPGYLFSPSHTLPSSFSELHLFCYAEVEGRRALQHTAHRTPRSCRFGCKQQQQQR